MAFEKIFEYKTEVLPSNIIQVRRADIVLEDGERIATTYHRSIIHPGDDVSEYPENVQAIVEVVHTEAVVAAYAAEVAAAAEGLDEPEEPAEAD